jgi:hypothetical protein
VKARKGLKKLRQLGRPRKEGVARYDNGRIVRGQDRERPEDATRTVREARQRHLGVKARDADDPKHGDALMALLKAGNGEGISQKQYDALDNIAKIYARRCNIAKGLNPHTASPAALMLDIAPHRDLAHPDAEPGGNRPSPEDIEAMEAANERDWSAAYLAVIRHGFQHGQPSPYSVMHSVAFMNNRLDPRDEIGLGNLRIAANILIHLWRM